MSFCWVTIHVKDMEKSLEFYQEITGLEVRRRHNPVPHMELVFLGSDETNTQVELIRNSEEPAPEQGKDLSLGFTVDSIEETMGMLKSRNIMEIDGPYQPGPGIKFIFIKDPDGVKIQLVELITEPE